LDYQELNAIP